MQVLRFDLGPSLHRRNGLKNSIMSGMSGAAPAYHTRATPGSAAAVAIVARAAGACALLLVSTWVHGLGGVSSTRASDGGTDALFNWHPVLMTLAYAVFMTEALLAYKAPWQRDWARRVDVGGDSSFAIMFVLLILAVPHTVLPTRHCCCAPQASAQAASLGSAQRSAHMCSAGCHCRVAQPHPQTANADSQPVQPSQLPRRHRVAATGRSGAQMRARTRRVD